MSFEAYESSSAQKRLYMINHLLGDSILYNELRVWAIEGKLDPSRLKEAVNRLSQRHETLRTSFVMKDGEVLQKVYDHIEIDFKYMPLKVTGSAESSSLDIEKIIGNFLTAYDLGKVPLWKIRLVQLSRNRQLLLFDFHHIIADGTSMDIIIGELTALYLGKPLSEPQAQYVDFTIWQNDHLQDERVKKQEAYWLEVFGDEIPVLELPLDSPRSMEADIEGSAIEFEMEEDLTAALNQLALKHNTTLYVVLLAGLNVLLGKYSGREDIVIGTPISGRTHREFEQMVGMFVNTLAMRNRPVPGKTFGEFLQEVSQNTFAAFENQDYQFEMLVEKVAPGRQLNRNPLFDVMFALQNYSGSISLSGLGEGDEALELVPYPFKSKVSKFDLSLQSFETEGRIVFLMEYRSSLFRKDTVERTAEHFINIFREVVANCDLRLWDIPMLSETEKDYLLYELNDTAVDYPADKTLHELFEEEAGRFPDKTAVVFDHSRLTYNEFDKKANQLAGVLQEKAVRPGSIVGIMVERSMEMLIGILGILKAGGVYLPIDSNYPRERIDYMLADSDAKLVVTADTFDNIYRSYMSYRSYVANKKPATCNLHLTPAYIIYTSGSTGKPKGVMVEHRNAVRLVKHSNFIDFTESDKLLLTGSIVFDITTFEIWAPLLNGSTLVLADQEAVLDGEKLEAIIDDNKISVLHLIPQLFNQLAGWNPGLFAGLKYLLVGGDVVPPLYINKLRRRYKELNILHMYGPTENTTFSTYFPVDKEYEVALPIGKPVGNSTVYIMDKQGGLKPPGAVGELWVGGAGVARGYLNQPELTAEKFIRINMSYLSYRTYKTGDLARWLPDGNVEFLGRMDHQVKIRGIRIELGEIENRLLNHPAVNEAVVLASSDESGDRYLCAYIASQKAIDITGIRSYLSERLPDYMIPAYIVRLDTFPLTPGGKVDRKALPSPEIKTGEKYIAPRDTIDRKLAEIWSEVLNIDKGIIGITGNFFQLGGHSLKAAILTSKIHKEFNVKVPLAQLFKLPDIKGLSGYIRDAAPGKYASIVPVEKKEYYELSSAQKRLYFLQQLEPGSTSYIIPVTILLKGLVDKERLEATFHRLIDRHENLRTSFAMTVGGPVQKVNHSLEFRVMTYDFSSEETSAIPRTIIDNFSKPFDLSQLPLFRVGLLKIAEEEYMMLIDIHHIIADGTSVEVMKEDFAGLYAGGRLAPLYFQYKDFSVWQNALFASGKINRQEDYWLHLYAGEIPNLNLPTDYPRPGTFTFEGETHRFKLDREETSHFNALSRDNNATLYMNMLTVFNLLLHRYTGQCDIIVGTGIAGRPHADLQGIIGMFVNMLAVRNYPGGHKPYNEFLKEVRDNSLNAYENQDVQFEELVDKLGLARDASRNPLFDVTMVVQNVERKKHPMENLPFSIRSVEQIEDPDIDLTPYKRDMTTSKFDMTLFIYEIGDEIHFNLEYYTGIFKRESVEGFARHFLNIIRQVNDNAEIKIAEIDILSEEEKQELLFGFNNTKTGYPPDKTIHELYEDQVRKNPDDIALVHEDASMSYGRLDETANRLANYLCFEKGVQPGEPAAVLMDKSLYQVVALLGILKTGGAYLPIDPSTPEARIKNILDDSALRVVISLRKHIRVLNRLQWQCKCFDTFLCMDSRDVYGEDEEEMCGLMDQKLWDYVAESAVNEITGGGWLTSYTGEPFTKEEMDEYGDNALKKLMPLLHDKMNVLEIGCGSGITMYRLAPRVRYYYGTDLSEKIIETNKQRVNREGHKNIVLSSLAAHEIEKIKERNFDLIIINSVIQSFHGHNYLRKVIARAVDLLGDKGYLFIGDVMDQELKQDLTREMIAFKKANRDNGSIKTKTDWSAELFISRWFFEDLRLEFPAIINVEFSDKIYTIENELTKFRYDALMTIDKTEKENTKRLSKHEYQHDIRSLEKFPGQRVETAIKPADPAYIIFTSGSTGKPKGVMVEHKSVIRLVKNSNFIDLRRGERLLLTGSIAFDITTFEIWAPLLSGLALHLVDKGVLLDAERLGEYVVKTKISILHLIPRLFEQVIVQCPELFAPLTYFLVGGDLVQPEPVNRLRNKYPGLNIIHAYGPTENTTFSTTLSVDKDYGVRLPIGRPVDHSAVYILDRYFNLQPKGVAGELCVGGDGLARGYLNQPELTAEKFVAINMSYMSHLPYKTYRTGDLARWLLDGTIEFLGRIDQQVKVRGFRIEPGEIEDQLLTHEDVREAVVIARDDEDGDKYLCAYIVGAGVGGVERTVGSTELREYLSKRLPGYMIPSYFMQVEKIPLTSNGKIDSKAFPEPGVETGEGYSPPANETEKKLVEIWSDILGIKKEVIGIDANFFELGGHSLKATLFVSRAHKELNVKIPLAEVFKDSTIRTLSQFIEGLRKDKYISIEPVEKRDFYPLSSAQKRLFVLQQLRLDSTVYNMPDVLTLELDFDKRKLNAVLEKLIARHESLRTSFLMVDDEPVQVIHDRVEFEMEFYESEVEVKVEEDLDSADLHHSSFIIHHFVRPFDLSRAPLLRVGLIRRQENKSVLLLDMHHIISDGVSHDILGRDFQALYNNETIQPLRLQYKDFAGWQNRPEQREIIKQQERYWLREFAGPVSLLDMPTDYARPDELGFEGSSLFFTVDSTLTKKIKEITSQLQVTLMMFLLSVYNILLAKYTDREEIIVGTVVAGRRHADLQDIIGFFVNMLAIRTRPARDKTFLEYLMEVKETALQVYENQEYQFEKLVGQLQIPRHPGRHPLIDTAFALLEFDGTADEKEKTADDEENSVHLKSSHFDLTFLATALTDSIRMHVEYSTSLFKKETIEDLSKYYFEILEQVVENIDIPLKEIKVAHDLVVLRSSVFQEDRDEWEL